MLRARLAGACAGVLLALALTAAAGATPNQGLWRMSRQLDGLSAGTGGIALRATGAAGATSPAGATGATSPAGATSPTGTGLTGAGVTPTGSPGIGLTGTTDAPYTLPTPPPLSTGNPLSGRAVWIWELPQSSGGNVAEIIATAHRDGVRTVIVKSSDGTGMWSQFTPELVAEFHEAHLNVCAWQYVYGQEPTAEAERGAQAVKDGADCVVIDAEGEYDGKYVSAQTYMSTLRRLIGPTFPVALAGLPYIDYHPAFPYSVFLGPGGAQYDMPQMYWQAIGTTVGDVFTHTYAFNRLYGRAILPLGQIYDAPPISQIIRFRQLAQLNGAKGISWWDYQEAKPADFTAISRRIGHLHNVSKVNTLATLSRGAQGDLVVWAQEHLDGAGFSLAVDGGFGRLTQEAVLQYQNLKHLPITGEIDGATWASLLRVTPAAVTWVHRKGQDRARVAVAHTRAGGLIQAPPESARLPDRGEELPLRLGAART